jgi:hypothetical protein
MGFAHNSGYAGYYELRMAIWDSNEPLIAKALALAILEHMRPDKLEAYPSRSRLARMCGISENTLERHWATVCQWIDVIKERGKRNLYRARVYVCAKEIASMLTRQPPQAAGGGLNEPPPREYPPLRVPTRESTPHSGGYTTPQSGGSEDSIEDSRSPLGETREIEIKNPASWGMAAAMSAEECKAQRDVAWNADGGLRVLNGFAAFLGEKFPRVSLDVGLAIVASNIGEAKSRMPAVQVKDRIVNKFAYLESDERGRDRRAAVRQTATPPPGAVRGDPPGQRLHWRDEQRESERRMAEAERSFDWS